MRIEGVPEVGCGDEPPVTHSLYFRREALYQPISGKVFQDSIGIDDIEGFIGEGQRAAVEYDRLHAGETVTVILHVVEGNTTADNLRAVLVKGFKLLRLTNAGPGRSNVQDAHCGSRAQYLQEEPVLLLPRFAMQVEEQTVHK